MGFLSVLWDLDDDPDGNVQHCADHGVTQEEVEQVLDDPDETGVSNSSGYPAAFGYTAGGRHLIVVYEEVDPDTAYPITAYDVPPRGGS